MTDGMKSHIESLKKRISTIENLLLYATAAEKEALTAELEESKQVVADYENPPVRSRGSITTTYPQQEVHSALQPAPESSKRAILWLILGAVVIALLILVVVYVINPYWGTQVGVDEFGMIWLSVPSIFNW